MPRLQQTLVDFFEKLLCFIYYFLYNIILLAGMFPYTYISDWNLFDTFVNNEVMKNMHLNILLHVESFFQISAFLPYQINGILPRYSIIPV